MPNGKPNFYELYRLVGGIDKKLDQAIKQIDDHHSRLNTIEKTQDTLVGKIGVWASLFGFIGGIIITVVGWLIKSK